MRTPIQHIVSTPKIYSIYLKDLKNKSVHLNIHSTEYPQKGLANFLITIH